MVKVVLTADRALFTDFNSCEALGFGLCMPMRLVPRFIEYRILAPPAPVGRKGRAAFAPYALAKVEAALLAAGFRRDEIVITPPEHVEKVIDKDTAVVGVHVVDPQGLAPVSWTLRVLTGGGVTCTQYEFEKLMEKLAKLRRKYRFKVIVGGPGVWQLKGLEEKFNIDVLFDGEAELTFPLIVRKVLSGEDIPRYVRGDIVPADKVPLILTPSRNGVVQITRGCPRRCQFCSPTMFFFRSIPINVVLREIELNLKAGVKGVGYATEDVLLYGARGLDLNPEAVMKLFSKTLKVARRYGIDKVGFSHVTLSSALVLKNVVKFITDVNGFSDSEPTFPQVGLESGSPRIVGMYFRGKAYPWSPEEWPDVVLKGAKLLNDNYWYPCLTYIIGFPDTTPEDYLKTTELIDKLRDEGFKGWVFPLLLVPIGGTQIESKASFKVLKDLPQEALDCITAGWILSIKFSRAIYPKVFSSIRNPLIHKIVSNVTEKAIEAMANWILAVRRNPEVVERKFSRINLRYLPSLVAAVVRSRNTLVLPP